MVTKKLVKKKPAVKKSPLVKKPVRKKVVESLDATAKPLAVKAKPSAGAEPYFFAVSIPKLIVMSICTLGIYEVYWIYMNWRLVRDREMPEISAGWRAFFGLFYIHPLLQLMNEKADELGLVKLAAGALTLGWVTLTLLGRLPDPYWMVTFFTVLCVIPVQRLANEINDRLSPGHDKNDRYEGWNWAAIVVGGFIFLACISDFIWPSLPPA